MSSTPSCGGGGLTHPPVRSSIHSLIHSYSTTVSAGPGRRAPARQREHGCGCEGGSAVPAPPELRSGGGDEPDPLRDWDACVSTVLKPDRVTEEAERGRRERQDPWAQGPGRTCLRGPAGSTGETIVTAMAPRGEGLNCSGGHQGAQEPAGKTD